MTRLISARFRGFVLLVLVVCCGLSSRSYAQTSPDLLVKPWEVGQGVDTSTDAVFEAAEHTRESQDNVRLSSYHALGRVRLFPDAEATPRIGYDVLYYDIDSHDKALPHHLWDGTVGFAQPVAEINKWFVVLTGAAGYAGDTPFSDPHAAYFTGNLIVGREFTKDKAIVVALNYDGNRTFLPDIPIPGIGYADRYNDQLTYVLGVPFNSLTYNPLEGLQVDAGYGFLQTFSARVGYEFLKHYSVYTSYTDRLTGFHLSNLPEDHRVFLQEHRIETGFRFNPTRLIRFSVGGGWAFGQELADGFDSRELHPFRHFHDAPFGRVLLEIGF